LSEALADLLDMLDEWSDAAPVSGFAGFDAVTRAERLLGRPESQAG
jgi:hypothetical protein